MPWGRLNLILVRSLAWVWKQKQGKGPMLEKGSRQPGGGAGCGTWNYMSVCVCVGVITSRFPRPVMDAARRTERSP